MELKTKIIIALLALIMALTYTYTTAAACSWLFGEQLSPVIIRKCPPLVDYSFEDQQKIAKELKGINSASEIARIVSDYSKLRDACRVK
jgi:hypothetical protein